MQGAIEAAQRWVAPDPFDDEAQHRLIAALADAGERTAAIRQFETYERLLQNEQLSALDETNELIKRIRTESAVGPALSSVAAPAHELARDAANPSHSHSTPRASRESFRLLRLPRRVLAPAAAVILLFIVLLWGAFHMRAQLQRPQSSADVAVLPFTIHGDGDAAYLADGMVNLLGTALDGPLVRPADARAVFALVGQENARDEGLERGARVAERLGVGLFVMGDVIEAGNQLRIEAAVYRVDGANEPISRGAVSGGAEHVFQLVDSLAAQLLAGLGAMRGDRLTRTAAVTTASLTAFKAFLQGEAEIRAGRFERAEEALRRAVALDSTFAVAHYRLALALDWAARGDSEEAARAAARHAARLTPRDRALLEALQAYSIGDAPDAERRYRTILARYPDDLDALSQLGEVLSHFGPIRGRPSAEAEAAWRKVLSYEPRNPSAIVHLARIAAADRRASAIDSLLAPFTAAEVLADRRLVQVAAFRALAKGDTSTMRNLLQRVRDWEEAAVWQFAAYLTAYSDVPAAARSVVEELSTDQRAAGIVADFDWFAALLHLENGQLANARGALNAAIAANAAGPNQWHLHTFELIADWWLVTLPLPFADSTLARIRRTASSSVYLWRSGVDLDRPVTAADPLWSALTRQSLGVPNRMEALRLYTVGALSLRLRDDAAASTASRSLGRVANSDSSDWFVRTLDAELRARRAAYDGNPAEGLRILEAVELGAVPVGATNVVPFFAHAQHRYLRGELLAAVGRHAEALRWFASLGALSVPESPFRAPAHLRQAEIHERLGNTSEAAAHYARVLELWRDSDPEFQAMVTAARQRRMAFGGEPSRH